MKLRTGIKINGRAYSPGDEVPWYSVYPFFLFHMLAFGGSGFFMAYGAGNVETAFLFAHGGIAITVYTVFYLAFFGLDEVKWMFINAALGVLGIYAQVGWLLELFGRDIRSYPLHIHVIPFLYYTLYTFLLRRALLDLFGAAEDGDLRTRVDNAYVGGSVFLSALFLFI